VRSGRATAAAPRAEGGFTLDLEDGTCVGARRLLVATGLVDELPDVPGVRERWGRDVLHCPCCHGWEVRDQAVGVLGTGPFAVHVTHLFRQLTGRMTLVLHTAPALTTEQREEIEARGVTVVEGEVVALEVTGDRLTGARLASGDVVPLDAVVVSPRVHARDVVLASLGVAVEDHPMGIGTVVPADPMGLTSVPGVWVAGNVTNPVAQGNGAAAAGTMAGAAINADLIAEEGRQRRRGTPRWNRRRVESWAGRITSSTAGRGPVSGHQHHGGHHHGHDSSAAEDGHAVGAAAWDERYRSAPAVWSGRPNPVLVSEAADLHPGTALDIGAGEGADAIWLADCGWHVTAVDISAVALEHARAAGDDVAGRIRWQQADVTAWTPQRTYDLVSAHFMHLPAAQRDVLNRRLAAEVAGPLDPAMWTVLVSEDRPRTTTDPAGATITIHDAVLRAQRNA